MIGNCPSFRAGADKLQNRQHVHNHGGAIKMSNAIDRADVLARMRRIENLCKEIILQAAPSDAEAAQLGCASIGWIMDGYSAVTTLLRTPGECHSPTVVRTMYEAFADLRTLAKDERYELRMKLHAANERKRAVKGYVDTYAESPQFAAATERARTDLANLEKWIKQLIDDGIQDYKVWERFTSADLEEGKSYVYGEFSSFAHADYIAIMVRHTDSQKLLLGAPLPDAFFAKVAYLSSTVMLDSLLNLPSFAAIDEKRLHALRDEAIKEYKFLPLVN